MSWVEDNFPIAGVAVGAIQVKYFDATGTLQTAVLKVGVFEPEQAGAPGPATAAVEARYNELVQSDWLDLGTGNPDPGTSGPLLVHASRVYSIQKLVAFNVTYYGPPTVNT